jgi:hypothetical protein
MPSQALDEWTTERASNLRELFHAHTLVGGSAPGRRWRTQQLNLALILRLAAEFQGYCRDLHDLAADEFAVQAGRQNDSLQQILRVQLTQGRKLDSGNAGPGNIGSDFARIGLQLWSEVDRRRPRRAPAWNSSMTALNDARNAVAHDDRAGLARIAADGYRLTELRTMKVFQRDAGKLVTVMDDVVSSHLAQLFGGIKPW